jgi:diphthamide biosynthesis protein 4
MQTHYETLHLEFDGDYSLKDIKQAYRAAILAAHPDRSRGKRRALWPRDRYTVDAILAAYKTLRNPTLRAAYDRSLVSHLQAPTEADASAADDVDLDDLPYDRKKKAWIITCRCGAVEPVDKWRLEEAWNYGESTLLVPCEGCSLWVRVRYAAVECKGGDDGAEEEDDDTDDSRYDTDDAELDDDEYDDEAHDDEEEDNDNEAAGAADPKTSQRAMEPHVSRVTQHSNPTVKPNKAPSARKPARGLTADQ